VKSIIMTDESHLSEAEIEGVVFKRGVAQLVADGDAAEILRHPWFAEAPPDVVGPPRVDAPEQKPAPLVVPPSPPSPSGPDRIITSQ